MLCKCSLSPHVFQPSNKSRVSILWLFHIVVDKSSSDTSHISTRDVYHLSMDNDDPSSCRHCRQQRLRTFFGLSLLAHFDLSALGLPVMRTSSCTAATSCNHKLNVINILSRVRQPLPLHVHWQFSGRTTQDAF